MFELSFKTTIIIFKKIEIFHDYNIWGWPHILNAYMYSEISPGWTVMVPNKNVQIIEVAISFSNVHITLLITNVYTSYTFISFITSKLNIKYSLFKVILLL